MWSMLCLVAVAFPPLPAPAPLATGTLVRLSVAPRPRSGDPGAPRYAVPVRREGPLLVFTYADGSTSASLLPGASVTGHFEGTDASWVHLRRSADRPPMRVHRGSVPLDALGTLPIPSDNGAEAPWREDSAKPAAGPTPGE